MSRSSTSSIRTTTIGRSPEMPCAHRPGAPRSLLDQQARRRAQRRVRVEDPVGQPLEEVGLVGLDAEVMELHLGLRPGEDRRPLERRRLAVLVGQIEDLFASTRRRPWRRSRGRSRPERSVTRQRRLKIGSSTAPTVFESGRPSITETGERTDRPRPRNAGAIRLVLDDAAGSAPRPRRRVRPRSAGRRSIAGGGSPAGHRYRGRTRSARTGSGRPGERRRRPAERARSRRTTSARSGGSCELRLVSDTRRISASCSADTTTVKLGHDRAVAPRELGTVLRVGDLVAVGLRAARLVTGRPHLAGVHVAHEEIAAPRDRG